MDTETRDSYNAIANMMENVNMNSIMSIFAEKILMNLIYCSHDEEEATRIINVTLEVFTFYTGATSSCRLIGGTEIMQKLISDGHNNYQILQHPSQVKQLGNFYRILLQLWLQDDYVHVFEQNISQLNSIFTDILQI